MTAHPTQVRIGIIGLGEVAQIIHLQILRALPDRFRVTAIGDVPPALLAFVGTRYAMPPGARLFAMIIDAIRETAASS